MIERTFVFQNFLTSFITKRNRKGLVASKLEYCVKIVARLTPAIKDNKIAFSDHNKLKGKPSFS